MGDMQQKEHRAQMTELRVGIFMLPTPIIIYSLIYIISDVFNSALCYIVKSCRSLQNNIFPVLKEYMVGDTHRT